VRLRQSDENLLSTLFKVTSSRVSSVDTFVPSGGVPMSQIQQSVDVDVPVSVAYNQ